MVYGPSNIPLNSQMRNVGIFRHGVMKTKEDSSTTRVGSYKSKSELTSHYMPFPTQSIDDLLAIYFEHVYPIFPMVNQDKLLQRWKNAKAKVNFTDYPVNVSLFPL
jgi:hypothetical protein